MLSAVTIGLWLPCVPKITLHFSFLLCLLLRSCSQKGRGGLEAPIAILTWKQHAHVGNLPTFRIREPVDNWKPLQCGDGIDSCFSLLEGGPAIWS
uniref:Putative secreted protein n=1 Tax=Ixodes scapularis TaxID=6945 RepID=A0A4D5RD44_IXOSC